MEFDLAPSFYLFDKLFPHLYEALEFHWITVDCALTESTEIKSSFDCIHLSCEVNTGHINTLEHVHKRCNLYPSNTPKNTKNGPVLVKKLNY